MKSSKQLQTEIESLETQLAPLNSQLDQLILDFAASLPPTVKSWMEGEVRRHIESNSEKVMAQGPEFARAVKVELQELYSHLDSVCLQAVGEKESWPHNKALTEKPASIPRSSESFFSTSFRRAISPLGAILNKHGLLDSRGGNFASWKQVYGNEFQYAYNPGFDERAHPAAVTYKETALVQDRLVSSLHAKRTELDQAKARELWDEA